ncbi:MAG: tetratricopeptide repeat protein, partial [Salinibacter sp.]
MLAVYFGLGLLLAPVPLLNVLQVESAAVVAFVAFFVAGNAALRAFARTSRSVPRVLGRQEAALLVPLGVLLVAQFWAPNCTVAQGLLFYALFPGVTVVLAVSIAYALRGTSLSHPHLALAGIGMGIVVAGPLYDLGLHPQFYTYNHVFGGVLGPIYDEQLAVRPGLFVFRGLTLLWAGAAVLLGLRLRGRGPKWALPLCALAIGGVYFFSAPLGINTPAWYLQKQLGGHTRTAHFDLYYDAEAVDEATAEALAQAHEARYDWVRRRLSLGNQRPEGRIESYIYPNPEVKARLTGARTTSVTPVWLSTPQMHLLRSRVAESLGHELAHVLSRPYGLPGVRVSWAPGLIEGWAVALEPPSPAPSPDDLVLTAAVSDTMTSLTATARAVASRLSPWGFWTGRGAVSYATMGSFVQYLLDRFGPGKLKRVYAWGNFETVYGQSLRSLAEAWAAHLRRTAWVARDAHALVARRFTRPSLFEEKCPHYVPPARRHLQAARAAARRRDTTEMVRHLKRALARRPTYAAAHEQLARVRLARGHAAAVRRQLDTMRTRRTVGLRVSLADARAMEGATDSARALYAEARARTPHYAHGLRARLTLRDAVAARSRVVRILVSGDSAAMQARRLAALDTRDPAVRAWRGLRAMAAHDYETAMNVWSRVASPVAPDRPRGWTRAWAIQHAAWAAK